MIALLAVLAGVPNFAAGDRGLDYAVAPTATELHDLGARLAHDLRAAETPTRQVASTCDSCR